MSDRIILPHDPEAASLQTVTGWVSRNGRFYGNDERIARYDGSTHDVCRHCGKPSRKSHLSCDDCAEIARFNKWVDAPHMAWDGEVALYADAIDKYFFDESDLRDFLEEEGITTKEAVEKLRLYCCTPGQYTEVYPEDIWEDLTPDDGELILPPALEEAFDALNRVIREHRNNTGMWFPGEDAVDVDDLLTILTLHRG